MKLDRNENADGCGKYALINLRTLNQVAGYVDTSQRWTPQVQAALETLKSTGALEFGRTGEPDEFFVIKLKDKFAMAALLAYANAIAADDPEFAEQVHELAWRSGLCNPYCKNPD